MFDCFVLFCLGFIMSYRPVRGVFFTSSFLKRDALVKCQQLSRAVFQEKRKIYRRFYRLFLNFNSGIVCHLFGKEF